MTRDDLDRMIADRLRRDLEGTPLDPGREASLHEMVVDSFRGRMRWLVMIVHIVIAVFFGLGVYCGIRFFGTDDPREALTWLGCTFFCICSVVANKSWYWMLLNRNAVLREVKRLEIQIAQLARLTSDRADAESEVRS